jgi:hypothetical protein
LLKEAWTLAIETLSWMQMQRLSERQALTKTIRQLDIQDPDAFQRVDRFIKLYKRTIHLFCHLLNPGFLGTPD